MRCHWCLYFCIDVFIVGVCLSIVVLCPVGTSLLSNFARCSEFRDVVKRYGVTDWHRLSLDDPRNRFPDGEVCSVTRGHEVFECLKSFVGKYDVKSCAELSGLNAICELYRFGLRDARVVLLPTQSCNSLLCARVLKDYLEPRVRGVEVVVLRSARSVDDFENFVLEVLDKVVRRVVSEKKRGCRVFINATPGFKAEVSFMVLASILAGVDGVVYIHEAFSRGVSLPIPLLKLDMDSVEMLLKVFGDLECVDYGYALQQLDEYRIVEYIDRGIAYRKGPELCLRSWVRKLVEVYGGACNG